MLFVLFLVHFVHLTIGCEWQKIHNDAVCRIWNSFGQHYTKDGCLDRCSREGSEGVTYCSFAEGFNYALIVGCGTSPNCCIGSDHCDNTISGINAETYQCVSTQIPTEQPTNPSHEPTPSPTNAPTLLTAAPTKSPSASPSKQPTSHPSDSPTHRATKHPSAHPTEYPTQSPTYYPTIRSTMDPFIHSTDHTNKHLTEVTEPVIMLIVVGCLFLTGFLILFCFCDGCKLCRKSHNKVEDQSISFPQPFTRHMNVVQIPGFSTKAMHDPFAELPPIPLITVGTEPRAPWISPDTTLNSHLIETETNVSMISIATVPTKPTISHCHTHVVSDVQNAMVLKDLQKLKESVSE